MKTRASTHAVLAAFLVGLLCTGCPLPMDDADGQNNNANDNSNDNGGGDELNQQLTKLQTDVAALQSRLRQRVYGGAVAGTRVVDADVRIAGPDAQRQYEDFIVEEGVTLTVQSGAVIRCTGQFINRGTIVVEFGTRGADREGTDAGTLAESLRPAAIGVSKLAAASGEAGGTSSDRSGGAGGEGLSEFESRLLLLNRTQAGGAGGAALASGGGGGGAMTVIAAGPIVNEGQILAPGESASDGGGGGGGGIVVLASGTSISNASGAAILAQGGDGGDATEAAGPGGGGGGGIVHLMAPEIAGDGEIAVAGGSAGTTDDGLPVTAAIRSGGGGGGATAGVGGVGGSVPGGADADAGEGTPGAEGDFVTTLASATEFF